MTRTATVTVHAIQRWQQRVEPTIKRAEADHALQEFLRSGRARPRPRHWLVARPGPGVLFVFNARRPGVCVVLRGGHAVTVLTREHRRLRWADELGGRRRDRRPPQPPPSIEAWELEDLAA